MPEKIKEIWGKVLAWWNKFTNKQKTIIVAIVSIVIFTFVILIYTFTRPQYITLGTYDSTDAAEIIDILDEAGVVHRESADARTIEVEASQESQANYAIASAGYMPDSLKYDDFVQSGMSVTASDKEKQYQIFLEAKMERAFSTHSAVKSVQVLLNMAQQNGTLIAQQEESSAFIQLELDGTFTSANAAAMAKAAATYLRNDTTANITILDQDSNILFAGGDDYSSAGIASSMQELQNQAEAMLANRVKKVLYGTKQYKSIEVTSHLAIDFATYEETMKEYWAPDGREEGMKAHEDRFESSSNSGNGGVPGTDSNDGSNLNTYVNPDYSNSETEQEEVSTDYLPNEKATYSSIPPGAIDYGASSMAIAMITYKEYYEETVAAQGLLDGTTWEEFKEEHGADIRREVDEEFYRMAADATGISADKITIIAYESPIFYDKEGMSISGTDILSIVMIVLILALLAFVILRSMGTRQEVAEEEELSVESMLQSTPETVIEDIDLEAKSETRKMIEKFVDENPEAAAILLRNWLNEDWS